MSLFGVIQKIRNSEAFSTQHNLVEKAANSLLGCTRQSTASMSREVILSLCLALMRHKWVLRLVLGSPAQERQGHTAVIGQKDD